MLKGIVSGTPVDISRIAMKGKQLYDSAHSTAYAAVLDANNMWVNASTAKSIKIRVEPSTQYTLSIDSPNNSIFRICESDNADITPQSASSAVELTRIVRDTTIKQYTFTTSDSAQCIIFQGSSTSYEQWNSTLMLNLGSTALPYESYGMQQGWEVRDQQGTILWGADKTLTANAGYISYRGYGLPLKDVEVEGNMTQTGTPDLTTPIWPDETGERTGNLFDKAWFNNDTQLSATSGLPTAYTGRIAIINPIDVSDIDTVTLTYSLGTTVTELFMYSIFSGNTLIERVAGKTSGDIIDVTNADTLYICLYIGGRNITVNDVQWIMLNSGSTPLSYEPYGYKVALTANSTTTPIYLGQTQTTRRVKKLVLTGEEAWSISNSRFYLASLTPDYLRGANQILAMCSHYVSSPQVTSAMNVPAGCISFSYASAQRLYCYDTSIATVQAFKQYLAEQYAAGHPVTVWYVLAEPETGIVNEPIRKISTYADTLTVTDQDVTITPAVGNDTITVDTTLPPSKLSLTGHIKPAST